MVKLSRLVEERWAEMDKRLPPREPITITSLKSKDLPTELRLKIWEMAFLSPRIISVENEIIRGDRYPWARVCRRKPGFWPYPSPISVLFLCREPYEIASSTYTPAFNDTTRSSIAMRYLNFKHDILYPEVSRTLEMFEALTKTEYITESTTCRFLRLPLEIRCLIYSFVAPPTRRPGPIPWVQQRVTQTPNFDLTRYSEFQQAFDTSSALKWKDTSERCGGLVTLSSTNRQLYHEIRDLGLIRFHELRLGILDDQTLRHSASKEILELARQEFVRKNVVSVELFFAYSGKYRTDPDSTYPYAERVCDVSLPRHSSTFKAVRKIWYKILGRERNLVETESDLYSLKELATVLVSYPSIRFITMRIDHAGLFELWKDPKEDCETLLPLLRRGVKIQFVLTRELYALGKGDTFIPGFDVMIKKAWKEEERNSVYWERIGRYCTLREVC